MLINLLIGLVLALFGSLALLLVLLAIPVALDLRLNWPQHSGDRVKVRWAFGLVRVTVPMVPDKQQPAPEQPSPGTALNKQSKQQSRFSGHPRSVIAIVRQPRCRQRIAKFLGDLTREIKTKNLHLRVRIGLGDPADTGLLWALLGPLSALLANVRVELEPDFSDLALVLDSAGDIRFNPLRIASSVAAVILSSPIRRELWRLRKGRA